MNSTVLTIRNAAIRTVVGKGKQLIMFPFGGGSGYSFSGLAQSLAKDVEVLGINPPGHFVDASRPLESIEAMTTRYIADLRPVIKNNCVLFGHSLGGLVAYEMCKQLEKRINIKKLIVSSILPPCCASLNVDMTSGMSDEELVARSEAMGGMPQIFLEEPAMMKTFISGLRGDLKALEKYVAAISTNGKQPQKLKTSAVVLYSNDDYIVEEEKMKLWQDYLDCTEITGFPGHHFHLLENPGLKSVTGLLDRELSNMEE